MPIDEQPTPITVLINNYNYAGFLPAAIDSALAQTYRPVEVLVVDDGSTDGSRAVIDAYGSRVRSVFKANGGQASAIKAGLAAASGEIVMVLDADDLLFTDTAARVAAAFRDDPRCVHVHYRLEVVDAEGRPTGELVPPRQVQLRSGDLRLQSTRVRGFRSVPSSGNAYLRSAVAGLPPVPETTYTIYADRWFSDLLALVGTVRELPSPGGCYRVHGTNDSVREGRDLAYFTARLERRRVLHEAAQAVARAQGLPPLPARPEDMQDAALASWRLAAYKLGFFLPRRDLPALVGRGVLDCLRQPDKAWRTRAGHAAWFLLLAMTPRGERAARVVARRYGR